MTYLVYSIALLVPPYLAYISYNKFEKTPVYFIRVNIFLSFVILVLITGLRYGVGTDYYAYEKLYQTQPWLNELSGVRMEWGYTSLVNMLNFLGLPPWSFFILMGSGTITLVFFSFKDNPALLAFGLFFFVSLGQMFFSFNGVRQAFAAACLAVSIKFIYERRFLPFIFIFLIGFLFHKSLILLLPLYIIIPRLNWGFTFWVALFMAGLIVNLLLTLVFPNLVIVANFILSNIGMSYAHQFDISKVSGIMSILSPIFITRVALGFLLISYYREICGFFPNARPYLIMSFIGVIIYNSFSQIHFMARLNNYFVFIDMFSLSYLLAVLIAKKNYRTIIGLVIYFIGVFYVKILVGDNGVTPYEFI